MRIVAEQMLREFDRHAQDAERAGIIVITLSFYSYARLFRTEAGWKYDALVCGEPLRGGPFKHRKQTVEQLLGSARASTRAARGWCAPSGARSDAR